MYIIHSPNTGGIPHVILTKGKQLNKVMRYYLSRLGATRILLSCSEEEAADEIEL